MDQRDTTLQEFIVRTFATIEGKDLDALLRMFADEAVIPRIARGGLESSGRLGLYRWGVERTLSWLTRFLRLKVRYERRGGPSIPAIIATSKTFSARVQRAH